MRSWKRCKRVWKVGGAGLLCALLFGAVFIKKESADGFYVVSSPRSQGQEFLVFTNGNVYSCIDNHPMPAVVTWLGQYQFESGTGWVWTLRKLNRKIRCDPYFFYMRFEAIDGVPEEATDPFEWRDPFFWVHRRTLQTTNFVRASHHE